MSFSVFDLSGIESEIDGITSYIPKTINFGKKKSPSFTKVCKGSDLLSKKTTALALIDEHREWGLTECDVEMDLEGTLRTLREKKIESIGKVFKGLKQCQEISICFLMDTTGSMYEHVHAVRKQIYDITETLQKTCKLKLHVAFVGYKDHSDGEDHFEILNFTTDIDQFSSYVKNISIGGGGDTAEDVMGGLQKAIELPWKSGNTNIIFHIADAPPHGRQYYTGSVLDDYPEGHPSDRSANNLFQAINRVNIQYYFGKITHLTDRMIEVFRKNSNNQILVFNVSDPINIEESVIAATKRSVTFMTKKSMSITKTRLPIDKSILYEKREPHWSTLDIQKGSLVDYAPSSIEILIQGRPETKTRSGRFKIASAPFAHGSERAAYYAQQYHKTKESSSVSSSYSRRGSVDSLDDLDLYETDQMVLKKFLRSSGTGDTAEGSRYFKSMETQTLAACLADQYNALVRGTNKVKFLKTKVLRLGDAEPFQFYSVEKRYRNYDKANFVKISNNAGYVTKKDISEDYVLYCLAFSHWTHAISKGYLMVVDLQGQKVSEDIILLTDPAIHCTDCIRFNNGTNLGERGFQQFFATHKCNKYCRELGLS